MIFLDFLSAATKDDCCNFQDQAIQVCPEITDKLIQACLSTKIRSKFVQTSNQAKDKNTSPLKPDIVSNERSPFKIMSRVKSAGNTNVKRKLLLSEKLEVSSSNSSSPSKYSQLNTDTSPSVQSSLIMTATSSDQETQCELL